MKKKFVLIGSALLLLTVGGVTAINVINPSWRENGVRTQFLRPQEISNWLG